MDTRQLLSRLIPTALTKGLVVIGGICLQWVVAKKLSIVEVGQFASLLTLLMAASIFVRFGVEMLILRHGGAAHQTGSIDDAKVLVEAVRAYIIKRSLGCSLVIFSFILLLKLFGIDDIISLNLLLYTAVLTPFFSLLLPWAAILRSRDKAVVAPFWEPGGIALCTLILVVVFWYFRTPTFQSLCISFSVVVFFFSVPLLSHRATRKNLPEISTYQGHGDYGVTQLSIFISQWGIIFLLSFFGQPSEVALLNLAMRLAMIISFVQIIANSVIASKISAYSHQGELSKIRKIVKKTTPIMMLVAIPLFLFMWVYTDKILMAFGSEYIAAKTMFRTLIIAHLYTALIGLVVSVLAMSGHQKDVRKIMVFGAIITLVLSFPIIYWGEVVYLAWLIAGISISVNTYALVLMKKRCGFTTLPVYKNGW